MRMAEVVRGLGRCVVGACLVVAITSGVCVGAAQAAGVSGRGTWETTLQGRDLDGNAANGFEAYYDTALDITWLADANFAKTSGYAGAHNLYGDLYGGMNWDVAQTWAANLNVNGVTGWRLPTLVDTGTPGCNWAYSGTDCGYNVNTSTSELAHLFHVTLGNKAYYDASGHYQSGWGLTNTGPFKNVQSWAYWSGVAYAPDTAAAWGFDIGFGMQAHFGAKYYSLSAWAVRSGDVAAAVPEPQTYALALAGLAVSVVVRRRRAA